MNPLKFRQDDGCFQFWLTSQRYAAPGGASEGANLVVERESQILRNTSEGITDPLVQSGFRLDFCPQDMVKDTSRYDEANHKYNQCEQRSDCDNGVLNGKKRKFQEFF